MGKVSDYLDYIATLNNQDDPDIFGMHENANLTFQSQESNLMIKEILNLQVFTGGAGGGGEGEEGDAEAEDPTQVLIKALLKQIPALLVPQDGNEELFVRDEENDLLPSLTTVLLQEIEKFNRLLKDCVKYLKELSLALKGIVPMSTALEHMYNQLMKNEVPDLWKSYPSLKPLSSWITNLVLRVEFIHMWLTTAYPKGFWMSGLFYPQGFLTGVLQTHARKYQLEINKLVFQFKILDYEENTIPEPPLDGVYVYGLYLDAARWDRKRKSLVEQNPNELSCQMPVIHFQPVKVAEGKESETGKSSSRNKPYMAPCYKTSKRQGILSTTGQSTNFICYLYLPTSDRKSEHWTKRGTALLT